MYYDCTLSSNMYGETFLQECPYPSLFDPTQGMCLDFSQVTCGTREEPLAPCKLMLTNIHV